LGRRAERAARVPLCRGRPERYPGFFAELLRLNPDVIVAGGGTPVARAAKQATSTNPNRHFRDRCGRCGFRGEPGAAGRQRHRVFDPEHGNQRETAALAQGGFAKIEPVAVLCDPADMGEAGAIETAALSLGAWVQVLSVSRLEEFEGAFESAKRARA
jgi:hypothetical protein